MISSEVAKKTVFWKVEPYCGNQVLKATGIEEKASLFHIIPKGDPAHPSAFYIAHYDPNKTGEPPLSHYLSPDTDKFGKSIGSLSPRPSVDVTQACFSIHSRLHDKSWFRVSKRTSSPNDLCIWHSGEQFYVRCSYYSLFKINGYLAAEKESLPEEDSSASKKDSSAVKKISSAMKMITSSAKKIIRSAVKKDNSTVKEASSAMKEDSPAAAKNSSAVKVRYAMKMITSSAKKTIRSAMKKDNSIVKGASSAVKHASPAMKEDSPAVKNSSAVKDRSAMKMITSSAKKIIRSAMKKDNSTASSVVKEASPAVKEDSPTLKNSSAVKDSSAIGKNSYESDNYKITIVSSVTKEDQARMLFRLHEKKDT